MAPSLSLGTVCHNAGYIQVIDKSAVSCQQDSQPPPLPMTASLPPTEPH